MDTKGWIAIGAASALSVGMVAGSAAHAANTIPLIASSTGLTIPGITGEQSTTDGDVTFGVTSDSIMSPSPTSPASTQSTPSPVSAQSTPSPQSPVSTSAPSPVSPASASAPSPVSPASPVSVDSPPSPVSPASPASVASAGSVDSPGSN